MEHLIEQAYPLSALMVNIVLAVYVVEAWNGGEHDTRVVVLVGVYRALDTGIGNRNVG